MAKTAMAEALQTAGYQHPRDRLYAIVDRIYGNREFKTRDAQVNEILRLIGKDTELLWALFEPYANSAVSRQLEEAMLRRRAQQAKEAKSGARMTEKTILIPPQGTSGLRAAGPSIAEREAAQRKANREQAEAAQVRALSKLDLFKINGRPIGDCTPEQALEFRASRVRDARYIWLVCAGVPHDKRIRDFIRPEEADALYERADAEKGNE